MIVIARSPRDEAIQSATISQCGLLPAALRSRLKANRTLAMTHHFLFQSNFLAIRGDLCFYGYFSIMNA